MNGHRIKIDLFKFICFVAIFIKIILNYASTFFLLFFVCFCMALLFSSGLSKNKHLGLHENLHSLLACSFCSSLFSLPPSRSFECFNHVFIATSTSAYRTSCPVRIFQDSHCNFLPADWSESKLILVK